ncbi:alpha/beta fold hydrolase [Saccharopolyspora sp. NPDC000359]|uniref:thioesterase II family protein n=1 Tax=Saccharopolyspora sp. NPDC000359 TaxID=3154251 RepID=UPI00332C280B
MLCFPHAGGAAGSFSPLAKEFTTDVEVHAVQYPGRMERRQEPLCTSVEELADRIFAALGELPDRPLGFFGHSMGATVAFEVAIRLERETGTGPLAVFVSGRRAPSTVRVEQVHEYDDKALLAEMRSLDGTDSRVLADEEILRMVLPTVRADYRAIETYRCEPGARLACPVVALVGDADPKATAAEVERWEAHTTGPFDMHVLPGGHFFLNAQRQAVSRIVDNHLNLLRCS